MKKKRIIPIVLFKDGYVVQSNKFSEHKNLGSPYNSIYRLSQWGADEVHFIDISTGDGKIKLRSDLHLEQSSAYLEVLQSAAKAAFMPLASGGGIDSLADIEKRLSLGADKIIINSHAFRNPQFVENAAKEFGSQCVTVSIDVLKSQNEFQIFIDSGKTLVSGRLNEWIMKFQERGAGEILLNSIDYDGAKIGFNMDLVRSLPKTIAVPLIICGGAGKWQDFSEILSVEFVDGAAAANIFQHVDQSVYLAHKEVYSSGINVRPPNLYDA